MHRSLAVAALLLAACGGTAPPPASPDASTCEPACESKACGDDGCGGTCGTCSAGTLCSAAGRCETPACVPQCAGKQCGPDGCGGSCGACNAGVCSPQGACEVPTCVPQCAGKACGPDGCGGICGSCAAGSACDAQGRCAPEKTSLNCPAGERCSFDEHTAVEYDCTVAPSGVADCHASGQLGTYTTIFACQQSCRGGNSSCGETHGRNDPLVAACLACVDACVQGSPTLCAVEVAGGCSYGDAIVPCLCR